VMCCLMQNPNDSGHIASQNENTPCICPNTRSNSTYVYIHIYIYTYIYTYLVCTWYLNIKVSFARQTKQTPTHRSAHTHTKEELEVSRVFMIQLRCQTSLWQEYIRELWFESTCSLVPRFSFRSV
jgi:hypothetical protein